MYEKLCLDLKECPTKIINWEIKQMKPLTKKEGKMHNKQKVCYICKKRFTTEDYKKYFKVKDHCHYTVN